MNVYAHSAPGGPPASWEPLEHHLLQVSTRCSEFAQIFGAARWGEVAGLLHDVGKLRSAFQAYLRGEVKSAEHSICGAVRAQEVFGEKVGKILAYTIAGHHGGLPDGGNGPGSLGERLAKAKRDNLLADMKPWPDSLALPELSGLKLRNKRQGVAFELHFLIRMLFSALVDADYLETERFYTPRQSEVRKDGGAIALFDLAQRLALHLSRLGGGGTVAPEVLERRAEVLRGCREGAVAQPGVFSLTVPTGGGKTFSSLAFALRHAERNGLRRVIYVIPYTSIIEQTADAFRTAFGDLAGAVIEHHSAAAIAEEQDRDGIKQLAIAAAENWDAPVIVTTSVQFFESLYSNKPSRCRKLHNIAQSVVVLDEVQALPLSLLHPCVAALRELTK